MPSGRVVTQTRARRRQSDAKWRAGVAMCYNIMKNAVPNQKKLGRRKISKALIIKETERHIANLERKLKELIKERAPMCGRTVLIEAGENVLIPATFEDIREDFADKQHSLFVCSSNAGRKRYSVPPDIESNLEQMRRLSCDLMVANQSEVKASNPQIVKTKISQILKPKRSATKEHNFSEAFQEAAFINESDHQVVTKQYLTPLKKMVTVYGKNMFVVKEQYTSTPLKVTTGADVQSSSQSSMYTSDGFTPIKLPYGLDKEDPMMALPGTPVSSSLVTPFSTVSIPQTPLTPGSSMTKMEYFDLEDDEHVTGLLCTESIDSVDSVEDIDRQFSVKNVSPNDKIEKTKCRRRLDRDYDSEQTVPTGVQNLPTGVQTVPTGEQTVPAGEQTVPTGEQIVPTGVQTVPTGVQTVPTGVQTVPTGVDDESCLDFDGYLLFHKNVCSLMDTGSSQSEMTLTIADMLEKLDPDDRATYAKMAASDQSDHSNALSDDLLGIELRPLHKEQNELSGIMTLADDTHEVPCLLTEISDDLHQTLQSELQFVEGFEDLGVFYPNTDDKAEMSNDFSGRLIDWEDSGQVVPQM